MGFRLTHSPIDPSALVEAMRDTRAGAFISFEGRVRGQNAGRPVTSLDYELYGLLAQKEGERILEEARAKFEIVGAECVHRTGSLGLGDLAVWVGVAAGHRGDGFEACRYIIDQVKARLPIWKKEHYADGESGWINCAAGAAGKGPL